MDNKLLIGIGINLLVVVFVLSAFSTPTNIGTNDDNVIDFNNINDDSNISLIKEETHGFVFVNNGSDPYYNFYVEGVLLNLPPNVKGYDLKTIFYGEDNQFLYEDDASITWLAKDFERSEQGNIGVWQTQNPQNVSHVEIIVLNPLGETVFNETLQFDMNKFDYSGLKEK